jgi:hypothetical protein
MLSDGNVNPFTAAGNAHLTCNQDEHATGRISFMHQDLSGTKFNDLSAIANPL